MNLEASQELARYNSMVDYFSDNKDRLGLKENQTQLTRLYATLLYQNKPGFKDLANKIHTMVRGPNYLLGHWEELERLKSMENKNEC
jgi:hypothetical protein